ncbi:hypothetical protein ACFW6S_07150 [Streptomyces sp. NPDC058740]|uniref:hypothetical protein n=1 Tax=Streptomyces sp. NPDC058740 TaxID=3346619 RepID=UPI00369C2351
MPESDAAIGAPAAEGDKPAELLRDIVQAAIKAEPLREIAARAVDPETGRGIPHTTLPKIAKGEGYRRGEPWLLRALAAGLGIDRGRVQLAASREWTELDVATLKTSKPGTTVVVAYAEGTNPEDLPVLQERLKELGLGDLRILPAGGRDAGS